MKPVLVHVHIFYPDLWAELKECIKNIAPHPFELFVTMVEEHRDIIDDVTSSFPDAKIEVVENRGYDVGPFVHILNQLNLDDYSYVIKLHTKRNMPQGSTLNYYDISGERWRKYALSMISSKENFNKCLNVFEQNNKIGMVTDYHLMVCKEREDMESYKNALEILSKLGLKTQKCKYVAGTMFMARTHVFKIVSKLNLKIDDFEVPDNKHKKITLAHVMERLFGCLITAQGYDILDIINNKKYNRCNFGWFWKIVRFLYQKKISRSGMLTIKVIKLPIYRKQLNIVRER